MSEWKRRRFWTEATTAPVDDGHAVHLDGRPLRTPAKALLVLPTEGLAALVAEEWQGQGDSIDPATMPATRMANSAIDKVTPMQAEVARLVADYGGSDLLCYRAAHPAELAERQQEWDLHLDWAGQALGVRLQPTEGVMPVNQPPEALDQLHAQVAALPPFELAPFHDLVSLSGSLVLGFAVAQHAITAEDGWRLSRIDETFQVEQWGEDADAAAAAEHRREAFLFARKFLDLARG